MFFVYIILGIIGLMLITIVGQQIYCWHYQQKLKHLNDHNLQSVTRDLYDDLDDSGWRWSKALQYKTAERELHRRGLKLY